MEKINQIEENQLYQVNVNTDFVVKDRRIIYNKYLGVNTVTGKALKELINECKGISIKNIQEMKIRQSFKTFVECLLKFENGTAFELFKFDIKPIDKIIFSDRLKTEMARV
jgi:hypothetical protein